MELIRTPCKNCVFAVWEDKTQVGCSTGQLDKYRARDIVIDVYDNTHEFCVIDGVCCPYLRGTDWLNRPENIKEPQLAVIEESKIKYQAIIIADESLDGIKNTLSSITSQTIKPKQITIVRKPDSQIRPRIIVDLLRSLDIPWRLENVTDKTLTDSECVQLVLTVIKLPFYLLIHSGELIPANTVELIDDKVKNGLRFGMITPGSQFKFTFVPNIIYEYFGGNKDESLEDKITKASMDESGVLLTDILWN